MLKTTAVKEETAARESSTPFSAGSKMSSGVGREDVTFTFSKSFDFGPQFRFQALFGENSILGIIRLHADYTTLLGRDGALLFSV